jgi:excinuclease UvrABC nuclease subunit
MELAAKDLDFLEAARYRDELFELEVLIEKKKKKTS